jgi:hypothetical protein
MQSHWKAALVGGSALLVLTADALAQNLPQPPANQLAPPPGRLRFTTHNSFRLSAGRSSNSR